MILRLRSRDGLERVDVSEDATVDDLKNAVEESLGVKREDQTISAEAKLLTAKEGEAVKCLDQKSKRLESYGIGHGSMLYLRYGFERNVPAASVKSSFETRPFGASMTVEQMVAMQTRIERQEKPNCASISMDRHAANGFQLYINQGLAFSVKRTGFMYGSVDDDKNVSVEFIYEPPQDGTEDEVLVQASEEEEGKVDVIASLLGLKRVGLIFSQSSKEKDHLISTAEIMEMAQMQDTYGELFVTAVVSLFHSEEGADIHFEAYQCTNQCVKLWREGWFLDEGRDTGVSVLQDPREPSKKQPVIVAGKDTNKVDNEWFLCPVKILDHEGALSSDFAVENRLTSQDSNDLKAYLKQRTSLPFVRALSDFHVLLFLAKHSNMDPNDIALITEAVRDQSEVGEGYKIIIESIARM